MKQAGYSKRQGGRSSDRYRQQQKPTHNGSGGGSGSSYSSFNEPKARGNPQQSVDKYLTLARDAATSGDPISAENYYQYADHYYRLALAARPSRQPHIRKPATETPDGSAETPTESVPESPPEDPQTL
jgi:hypothetical protein